jgi:hypothetical protein
MSCFHAKSLLGGCDLLEVDETFHYTVTPGAIERPVVVLQDVSRVDALKGNCQCLKYPSGQTDDRGNSESDVFRRSCATCTAAF